MKCTLSVIAFVCIELIACISGEDDDSVPNEPGIVDYFLGVVAGLDPSELDMSPEDAEKLFREKCLKNSGQEAYNEAKYAHENARECIMSPVNALQDEIEQAQQQQQQQQQSSRALDKVFKKYCRKTPEFLQCITNFTASVEPCLVETEQGAAHIIQKVIDKLLEFICYEEGSGIAQFIEKGGSKCIESNYEDILECFNTTLKDEFESKVTSDENLLMDFLEDCEDIRRLQKCIVNKLSSCPEPTTGKTVDSMFNYVYEATPCGLNPDKVSTNIDKTTTTATTTTTTTTTQQSKGSGSVPTVALTSLIAIVATRFL